MINIVFCGYREWANEIFDKISGHKNITVCQRIKTQEEYQSKIKSLPPNIDIFLFIGWSWMIAPEITEKYLCLGIHPSDLPNYRGGSPIQNQIINGVTKSKVSLMTLSIEKIDAGDIWLKENLDLSGNSVNEILNNIILSTIKLLNTFFNKYPNIKPEKQDISQGSYFKRRKSEQSLLTKNDFNKMSLKEIYNFIRCLTDPYPNAYMQDEDGNKLIFTGIKYIPQK